MYLFVISEKNKLLNRKEFLELLKLKTDGKIDKIKEDRLNWLLQAFSLKELTDLVRVFSYETYKQINKSKKKVKDIALEELNFFSLNDLPENFSYLEFKVSLLSSILAIKSDHLTMQMASATTVVEYKARTVGNDIVLNISEM